MNIGGSVGFSRYWAATEEVSHTLSNFYWEVDMSLYYKEFSLSAYYVHPRKTLYNESLSRCEKSSRVTLAWNHKNITAYAAVLNPFTPHGCSYLTESLSRYNPSTTEVTIGDNGNMFMIGAAVNFAFGKSFKKSGRRVNNADSGTSVLRVTE